jgi:hypothetical protein
MNIDEKSTRRTKGENRLVAYRSSMPRPRLDVLTVLQCLAVHYLVVGSWVMEWQCGLIGSARSPYLLFRSKKAYSALISIAEQIRNEDFAS